MKIHVAVFARLAVTSLLVARGAALAADPAPAEAMPVEAAGRLAGQLVKVPILRPNGTHQVRLFLMDLVGGEARPIVDEPDQGYNNCGSPWWSKDGKRILFDATPKTDWANSLLYCIDSGDASPKFKNLGLGNCPSFSPDGKRIAFLSNAKDVESGIYIMNADDSNRTLLGSYGRPKWSPDGRQILISSFSSPCEVSLIDVETAKVGTIQIADRQIFPFPSWADEGTIVAAIGTDVADSIALIDVTTQRRTVGDDANPIIRRRFGIDAQSPNTAKVKSVLWKRGEGFDPAPYNPIYHAGTRRCLFVGSEPKGNVLYSIADAEGEPARPTRLEPRQVHHSLGDLALSPDGRYLIYRSDRDDRFPR